MPPSVPLEAARVRTLHDKQVSHQPLQQLPVSSAEHSLGSTRWLELLQRGAVLDPGRVLDSAGARERGC